MIQVGDRVSHNTFPPVEGIVKGAVPILNGEPKLSVMQDNGILYWDVLSSWDLVEETVDVQQDFYDNNSVIDVEFKEV